MKIGLKIVESIDEEGAHFIGHMPRLGKKYRSVSFSIFFDETSGYFGAVSDITQSTEKRYSKQNVDTDFYKYHNLDDYKFRAHMLLDAHDKEQIKRTNERLNQEYETLLVKLIKSFEVGQSTVEDYRKFERDFEQKIENVPDLIYEQEI